MSNNTDDNRSGFKNSRIDLSQLGDDNWNKPLAHNPATPGPRRKPGTASSRRANLDDVFESRVHAATTRRAVKQNSGQNRVWLFASGLFLASVGGIAAAYYLVGPPMAMTAYNTDEAGYEASQTSSLEVDGSVEGTSSHFQGVPVSASVSSETPDYSSATSVMVQPPAGTQTLDTQTETETAARSPVAPPVSEQPAPADTTAVKVETTDTPQDDVAAVEPAAAPVSEKDAVKAETERMVRIVPTAVSEELETKTNVNAAKTPAVSEAETGQWVALPTETKPAAPSVVTAAASQQSGETKPFIDPVKSQQELFEAFQEYLESSGHTVTGKNQDQEELFNKFIRWSVEAPKGN
ncbi:hypothetical protein [Anderseniella sp. Alg231-50]|uniref:hypothetical protein n=1 Tax=Anderseniella sp. Alg231-50 TaxID=1922226 RepID=UPI00307BE257